VDDHTLHIQPDQTPDTADNLTVAQENAIDLLIQGHNDRQVAEAINVRRQTVCDWRNHNPNFRAELSRRRRDLRSSQAARLGHIATTAIDVLATDLVITKQYPNDTDRRMRQAAAVQVLKAYGSLNRQSRPKTARPTPKPNKPKSQSDAPAQPQTPEHDPLDWFHDFPPGG
jgi:hypothetical protein